MRKNVFLLFCFLLFYSVLFYGQGNRHPGGVTGSCGWFQTVYTGSESKFRYLDYSGNSTKVYSKEGLEYKGTAPLYINFHASMYTSLRDYHRFSLGSTNLSQGSVFGVFLPKQDFSLETFLYRVDGRSKEGFLMTTDNVASSLSSGEKALDYGRDTGRDLKYVSGESLEGDLNKFKETSARILTYERYTPPNTSIWGERTISNFSFGNYSLKDNPYLSSFFDAAYTGSMARFEGYSPEIIVYDRVLNPKERMRVETYLALKYGITLDKSYIDSKGAVLWDLEQNKGFNNRITGILRDNSSGLYQPISTTTYEESVKGSDYSYEHSSYDGSVSFYPKHIGDLPSSRYRLLVLGVSKGSDLLKSDGVYALWGDNNKSYRVQPNKVHGGLFTMGRVWKLRTNLPVVSPSSLALDWEVKDLDFTGDNWTKKVSKLPTSGERYGTAITKTPLLPKKEGVLSFELINRGNIVVKFGDKDIEKDEYDYGVFITSLGVLYTIEKGLRKQYLGFVFPGQRISLIKDDSVIRIVKGGNLLDYQIAIDSNDITRSYYGSVSMERSIFRTPTIRGFYHRGFVEGGIELELSYLRGKASELNPDELSKQGYKPYLIIDRTGKGDFSKPNNLEFIAYSSQDINREKLLFQNFFLDKDQSGMDAFTFGYKKPQGVVAYIEYTNPSCDIDNVSRKDGLVSVKLKDGSGPFKYQLRGINGTKFEGKEQTLSGRFFRISDLSSGDYKITITDTFGKGSIITKDLFIRSECEPAYEYTVRSSTESDTAVSKNKEEIVTTLNRSSDSKEVVTYPNPAKRGEPFTIDVEVEGDFKIYIYDIKGLQIDKRSISNRSKSRHYRVQARLNTSATYLIKVVTDSGETFTKRIIIN